MTRHFFWVMTAATVSLSLILGSHEAAAQQSDGSAAEAEASSADTSGSAAADTSSDSGSAQADVQADTQADVQADAQADTQANTQADAQADTQSDANAEANTQADASADSLDAASDQNTGPALPPPSASDRNADQPRERSRIVDQQQSDRQDSARDRDLTDRDYRDDRRRDQRDYRDDRRDDRRADRNDRYQPRQLRGSIEFGRVTDRGLMINNLQRDSFFYDSGLRRGDVIISVAGRPVRSDADFMQYAILQPGQRVPIIVLRDGRRETVYIVYREVAQGPRYEREYQTGRAYLGVDFDPQARDAVVTKVHPGSPAQRAGLQAGDIILALNGQEVVGYRDAISIVRSMQPGEELEVIVERARSERDMVVELDSRPDVRTAAREDVRVEVDTRYDDDRRDDGLLNRNRNDSGRRPLLPRLRN